MEQSVTMKTEALNDLLKSYGISGNSRLLSLSKEASFNKQSISNPWLESLLVASTKGLKMVLCPIHLWYFISRSIFRSFTDGNSSCDVMIHFPTLKGKAFWDNEDVRATLMKSPQVILGELNMYEGASL